MEESDKFALTQNSDNPSIKLKFTTITTSIDFLDTTTYKGMNFQNTNKLDIKVFFNEKYTQNTPTEAYSNHNYSVFT